jgi:hypothetical protein
MAEIVYADDYEAITGQKKPAIETKVVTAPAPKRAPVKVAEVK